jgi:hypothetical protein
VPATTCQSPSPRTSVVMPLKRQSPLKNANPFRTGTGEPMHSDMATPLPSKLQLATNCELLPPERDRTSATTLPVGQVQSRVVAT